jgi:UDP-glucuronate 4-epimerase
VDDIVTGVVAAHDNAPCADPGPPHRVYNIGNHQSEPLMRMISVLEDCLGKKAETVMKPMQMGDVKESFADIEAIRRDLGFEPKTSIDVGVPKFVEWFKEYNGIA